MHCARQLASATYGRADRTGGADQGREDLHTRCGHSAREILPPVRVLLLGPTEEDPIYFRECEEMVAHLGLGETFSFTGRVNVRSTSDTWMQSR